MVSCENKYVKRNLLSLQKHIELPKTNFLAEFKDITIHFFSILEKPHWAYNLTKR